MTAAPASLERAGDASGDAGGDGGVAGSSSSPSEDATGGGAARRDERPATEEEGSNEEAPSPSPAPAASGTGTTGTSSPSVPASEAEPAHPSSQPPSQPSPPPSAPSAAPSKVKVHFVAAGSAPILKKSKFLMNAEDRFAVAATFLRKRLGLERGSTAAAPVPSSSSLFLYVNSAFVPSPDEWVGDLFSCFASERGELVVHYSLQEAWG